MPNNSMKHLKFKPARARFRATFAAGGTSEPRVASVDREALTLHDVQITLEGEAKGHDVWLDRAFCEACAEQGNKMGDAGVKVRFGHPAMCSDAIGTYLGRAKNFRVVDFTRKETGDLAAGVIADIELDANADRTDWILNMAESAPDTFGQSIVFTYADFKVKDANGNDHLYGEEVNKPMDAWIEEHPDALAREIAKKHNELYAAWAEKSADGHVYAVMDKLLGTDFTDTPAATDGVFSDTSLAAEAERLLDENPRVADALENHPDNVYQFLSRIGILDKIESKRVAGIQAEKDREVAALKKLLAEKEKLLADTVAGSAADLLAAKDTVKAVKDELAASMKNLEDKDAALASATAEIEQLRQSVKESAEALTASREQLERLQSKHAAVIGGALNAVNEEKVFNYGNALAKARTPEERLNVARRQIKNSKR